MELLVAPVEHITFDIEVGINKIALKTFKMKNEKVALAQQL